METNTDLKATTEAAAVTQHPAAATPLPSVIAAPIIDDSTESRPTGIKDFALRVAWAIYLDLHVNLSGAVFFGVLLYGVLRPAAKDDCAQIAQMAGTYLFASAKHK